MNSLPLSWSIVNDNCNDSKVVNKWNMNWIALRNIHSDKFISQVDQLLESKSNTIVRGCNTELKDKFEEYGFFSTQIGLEAVLFTCNNHFSKKSLQYLVRRGKRNGKIEQVSYSKENHEKLAVFKKACVHGNEPQLQNLFQLEFKKNNLLYAFVNNKKEWLGAILLSENSKDKLHTELLLRRKNAPAGIMEALVEYCFLESKKNGYSQLSLGEVPFSFKRINYKDPLSLLSFQFGRILKFAYNYKGLYNFKQKFNPKWKEVFICASSKIGIKHLFLLFIYSNFHSLILQKLLYIIKDSFIIKFFKKTEFLF